MFDCVLSRSEESASHLSAACPNACCGKLSQLLEYWCPLGFFEGKAPPTGSGQQRGGSFKSVHGEPSFGDGLLLNIGLGRVIWEEPFVTGYRQCDADMILNHVLEMIDSDVIKS